MRSRIRPEAGHKIPLLVAVAVVAPFPLTSARTAPAREPVRLPFEKLLPRGVPVQIAPETLFHLRWKMLEMLGDWDYSVWFCYVT